MAEEGKDGVKAEIGGVGLSVASIEDSFSKEIAKYEFPYANGALLDDLGEKARTLLIKCHFLGPDYGDHERLIGLLQKRGPLRLLHPKYGVLYGAIEGITVRHDDRVRSAEAEIRFVENRVSAREAEDASASDDGSAEETFKKGQDESREGLGHPGDAPAGANAALGRELDPDKGILEQFAGATGPVWKYLSDVESFVMRLESTMTSIENPANTVITAIDYGNNVPGRVASAIARVAERYAALNEKAGASPAGRMKAVREGMDEAESSAPEGMKRHVRAGGALRAGLELGGIFQAELEKRRMLKRSEDRRGFNPLGQMLGPGPDASIMTSDEIEKALCSARGYLQNAVSVNRDMDSLREMAALLLRLASEAVLELGSVKTVELPDPVPMHKLCHDSGLPYAAGPRALALNPGVRNPNMLTGEVRVYAG